MPSYMFHNATLPKYALNYRLLVLGNEIPDLLKTLYTQSLNEAKAKLSNNASNEEISKITFDILKQKYYNLRTLAMNDSEKKRYFLKYSDQFLDMPRIDFFMPRLLEDTKSISIPDKRKNETGLHYGEAYEINIWKFWNSLTTEQKNNMFFRGILRHYLTDILAYHALNINNKMLAKENETFYQETGKSLFLLENRNDFIDFFEQNPTLKQLYTKIHQEQVKQLRNDWDILNPYIKGRYPYITLTPEIENLGVVDFKTGSFNYIDPYIMLWVADELIRIDPLANLSDLEDDIKYILQLCASLEDSGYFVTFNEEVKRKIKLPIPLNKYGNTLNK